LSGLGSILPLRCGREPPTPKVHPRFHGGQTCSMHPGWMVLEHLEGGGGWKGVGRWVLVGERAGHRGVRERVPRAGRGRTHSGGSRTTRQGSTTGVGPVGGRWGGFGVSWMSAMAGGAGCKEGSRWPVWKTPWRTHLCMAMEESGTRWGPGVSFTICGGVMPGWVGWCVWVW